MRKFLYTFLHILSAPFRFILWLLQGIYDWLLNLSKEIKNFFTEEVENAPLPDTLSKTMENPQELLVHFDALRKHLVPLHQPTIRGRCGVAAVGFGCHACTRPNLGIGANRHRRDVNVDDDSWR